MNAQAATVSPAAPATTLGLVGPLAEALLQLTRQRFDEAIQSVIDAPLDAAKVLEWTRLRALNV
jgi:hypothetical protein